MNWEEEIAEQLAQSLTAEIDEKILKSLKEYFASQRANTIDDIIFSPITK